MRKAVSARVTKKHLTKAEKEKRIAVENAFIDDAEIEPPSYLTKTQLEAFHFIVDALRQAKVLSRLDTQTIIQASVAIDMLHISVWLKGQHLQLIENLWQRKRNW